MLGFSIQPPSVVMEIVYEYYRYAFDNYYGVGGDPNGLAGVSDSLPSAYDKIDMMVQDHFGRCANALLTSVLVHTPWDTGNLNRSIFLMQDVVWDPKENLDWIIWQNPTYDEFTQIYYPGHWAELDYYMSPKVTMRACCYSYHPLLGPIDYAMPVETGSGDDIAPIGRLQQWAYRNWTAKGGIFDEEGNIISMDEGAGYRLRAIIMARGTQEQRMFLKGMHLASSELISLVQFPVEYWTDDFAYHLSDFEF